MKKIVLLACSILLLTQLFAQKTIAVKCGKLFDSKNGVMLSDQIILVKGNQIEQVIGNASIKDVKADSLIDLSGYTVLPGLIDCHVHALLQGDTTAEPYYTQLLRESVPFRTLRAAKSLQTSLMNGFTTVRDLGTEGAGYADYDLKKAIQQSIIPGPRYLIASLAIATTGHYLPSEKDFDWVQLHLPKGVEEITGADEGRRAVRSQIAHGADWIKIYADRAYYLDANKNYRSLPNFTTEEIMAIGDETAKHRKKMAAHAVCRDGILAAIQAGATSIEHGFGMDDECIRVMAEKKVYWCPTIYVNELVGPARAAAGSPMNAQFSKTLATTFQKALKAGVPIAYGTDIGGYEWHYPQARDLQYMVQWGMTAAQAIQSATVHAAKMLDMEGKVGECTKGAFADLIAVKGDPLQQIQLLEQVKFVMKDGKVYKQ